MRAKSHPTYNVATVAAAVLTGFAPTVIAVPAITGPAKLPPEDQGLPGN